MRQRGQAGGDARRRARARTRGAVGRRDALRVLGGLVLAGCGGASGSSSGRSSDPASPPPLKVDPVVDLAPAAGLVWLVDLRPRALLAPPAVRAAVAEVLPDARFDAFARRHGGVDLRRLDELVIAAYPRALLGLARGALDPVRIEAAFSARAESTGRSAEGGVTRVWGSVRGEPEALALLGRDALVLERGEPGPLRAAVYFAEQRLHRSMPALRAPPLSAIAALAGDAPVRAFAPGPFEGEWAAGFAGLLRAATAIAVTVCPSDGPPEGLVTVRLVLSGAWGDEASAAADHLRSAFDVLGADPLGRLTGIDTPRVGPTVSGDADALRLEVGLDVATLARGLHGVVDAELDEMMAR